MEDNAELESFRRQWREEVARRSRPHRPEPAQPRPTTAATARPSHFPSSRHEASVRKEEDDEIAPAQYDQGEIVEGVSQLKLGPSEEEISHSQAPQKEPESAIEHFERAVEKEAEGSLGDSLQLYRKAYRLDSTVDKEYRNKHFAWAWKKPAQTSTSNAPSNAPTAQRQPENESAVLPTPELIESFAALPIPQAQPEIENTPPPPCPISNVPSEVIVEILRHVALMDPASFCRVALVCKRLAYHFAHEQHIWKRLCQGDEFGFGAMHYSFDCDVHGRPEFTLNPSRYTPFPLTAPVQVPEPLSSWNEVFQMFPRIRFTGVYISTVNYTRAGAASAYQSVSWNSPIHIVTYFRYLRFYPDGSVISLLSTVEPLDVVPHISKENVMAARTPAHKRTQQNVSDAGVTVAGAPDPVPPVAMGALKHAHLGRWRLTKPDPPSEDEPIGDALSDFLTLPSQASPSIVPDPRDVVIETEGVGPKYLYVMHLSLRSSSAGSKPSNSNVAPPNTSKNTKLVWKGYWSYNNLTDDWAEFALRNDRAFVFRRVRGWDMN